MQTSKKPFRIKHMLRTPYTRAKVKPTPLAEMIRPNIDGMPKGMSHDRMDRIIASRAFCKIKSPPRTKCRKN